MALQKAARVSLYDFLIFVFGKTLVQFPLLLIWIFSEHGFLIFLV